MQCQTMSHCTTGTADPLRGSVLLAKSLVDHGCSGERLQHSLRDSLTKFQGRPLQTWFLQWVLDGQWPQVKLSEVLEASLDELGRMLSKVVAARLELLTHDRHVAGQNSMEVTSLTCRLQVLEACA